MRTLLSAIILLLSATALYAEPTGLAISAGYDLNNKKASGFAPGTAKINFSGLFIGADYTLDRCLGPISFTPGLYYNMGISKEDIYGGSCRWYEHNIFIPAEFSYEFDFAHWLSGFFYGGPSFMFNLASYLTQGNGVTVKINDFLGGGHPYRFFDVFLGLGLGFKICDHFRIHGGYEWGLINRISGSGFEGCSIKEGHLDFGLAYVF